MLLSGGRGGQLQIQLPQHGDHENVVLPGAAHGDEGLEDPRRVLSQDRGHLSPADHAAVAVIVGGRQK